MQTRASLKCRCKLSVRPSVILKLTSLLYELQRIALRLHSIGLLLLLLVLSFLPACLLNPVFVRSNFALLGSIPLLGNEQKRHIYYSVRVYSNASSQLFLFLLDLQTP